MGECGCTTNASRKHHKNVLDLIDPADLPDVGVVERPSTAIKKAVTRKKARVVIAQPISPSVAASQAHINIVIRPTGEFGVEGTDTNVRGLGNGRLEITVKVTIGPVIGQLP